MIHKKKNCLAHDLILADCCGLGCANCGVCKCSDKLTDTQKKIIKPEWDKMKKFLDKPEYGKQYALTGKTGDKCIMNGDSWSDSLVT